MRKLLLLCGAMLLSLSAMCADRHYAGAYNSDNYLASGVGLTSYPGDYSMVTLIPVSQLLAYDGGQVVGMRFAVAQPANTTRCFILDMATRDTLAVARVSESVAGWNEFTFDRPFTLTLADHEEGILMGYNYKQTNTNRPIGVTTEGLACEVLLYGNPLGQGNYYYDIGITGQYNLAVQAIVEKTIDTYSVAAFDFDDVLVQQGTTAQGSVLMQNIGVTPVASIDYVVTRGGVASAEQHYALTSEVTTNGYFALSIPLEAAADRRTEQLAVTVTKVNGQPNAGNYTEGRGKMATFATPYAHKVAVEEFTGTTCPWCPRGWQGMENLRNQFGDQFVGIALHQYSSSNSDAMFIDYDRYAPLEFSGAPSCMIERGEEMDPYVGTNKTIIDDFQAALDRVPPVGVKAWAMWTEDQTAVTAGATVEALIDGNIYDIEYVLVADSLTGSGSIWQQYNNYYTYNKLQVGKDLWNFIAGGKWGQAKINGLYFNDVALNSSYNGNNMAASLGQLQAYTPVESEYTIAMPTRQVLLDAVRPHNVHLVVLVVDQPTGRIVNADRVPVKAYDPSGIGAPAAPQPAATGAAYTLSGLRADRSYKGLVIKDGKKYLNK